MTPRGSGQSGFELDPKGAVNAEVDLEMPDDNVGWLGVTRAEANSGLPLPLKQAVLFLGDIWTALGRTWLKMLTAFAMGMAESWGDGEMKPVAGFEKLALKAWEAPRRNV